MEKLKYTLKSRKFWVAVASSTLFGLHGDYEAAVAVWLGWATVEGYIDAQRAKQGEAIAGILVANKEKNE